MNKPNRPEISGISTTFLVSGQKPEVTKFFPADPVVLRLLHILVDMDTAARYRDIGKIDAVVIEQMAREKLHDLVAELSE